MFGLEVSLSHQLIDGLTSIDIHEYLAGPALYGGIDLHDVLEGKAVLGSKDAVNRYTGAKLPQIIGHEMSGTITEIGGDVEGFQVGQRVTVNAAMDDRHHGFDPCEFCNAGRPNICDRIGFYGVNAKYGGFADEIVLKPFALVPIPDNVSLKLAALAEPLSVAAHMVRISGFKEGQDAVVLGAGPIGCALTFLLKDSGARRLIVSEVAESRAAQARASGADRVVNPEKERVLDIVRESMGTGADVVFDACGIQATLDTAIVCTKSGGTIFNVAIHEKPLQLDLNLLTIPEKRLLAGNAYTAEDYNRVIDVLRSRGSEIERFITAIVPLDKAVNEGFEEIVNNKAKHNKILIEVSGDE